MEIKKYNREVRKKKLDILTRVRNFILKLMYNDETGGMLNYATL